jgi:uncharacterized protein
MRGSRSGDECASVRRRGPAGSHHCRALRARGAVRVQDRHERRCRRFGRPDRVPADHGARETAIQKIRGAEDAWNTCDPHCVAVGYTIDCKWRNRAEIFEGQERIIAFLTRKWQRELEYRLIKELWAFTENRIAVRFAYEFRDDSGNWFRAYGNENWEYDKHGLNKRRHASINDRPIKDAECKFHWDRSGARPADHPSLSDLDL